MKDTEEFFSTWLQHEDVAHDTVKGNNTVQNGILPFRPWFGVCLNPLRHGGISWNKRRWHYVPVLVSGINHATCGQCRCESGRSGETGQVCNCITSKSTICTKFWSPCFCAKDKDAIFSKIRPHYKDKIVSFSEFSYFETDSWLTRMQPWCIMKKILRSLLPMDRLQPVCWLVLGM